MKLIDLKVKDYRNIEIAELNGLGNVVVFTGKNEQGKTNALEAIAGLFEAPGKDNIKPGAEQAEIIGKFDEFTIRRVVTVKGTRIEVSSKDGRPQTAKFLEKFRNKFALDQRKFMSMDDRAITRAIMDYSGVDLTDYDTAIKEAELERTLTGRKVKEFGMIEEVKPATRVDVSKLEEKNRRIREVEQKRLTLQRDKSDAELRIQALKEQLRIDEDRLVKWSTELQKLPDPKEEHDLSEAYATNKQADDYDKYLERTAEKDELETSYARFTETINELREGRKEEFVAGLKTVFGDEPLEFDLEDGIITLNGRKPSQWSRSRRQKTCLSLGSVSNPDAKLLLIDDAESMDDDSLREKVEWAKAHPEIQLIMCIRQGIAVPGADDVITIKDGAVENRERKE